MTASIWNPGGPSNVISVNGTLIPESFVATVGQTTFNITQFTYAPNTNSLLVFINGQKQQLGRDYAEVSSSSFVLLEGCLAGDNVDIIGFPQLVSLDAATLRANLANSSVGLGSKMIAWMRRFANSVSRTVEDKDAESVSVLDFGADPTGVSLSNTAFTNAKACCRTLLLPNQANGSPGIYRLEGWTAQDVRLIGQRTSGANVGANEQTVIEGSGDLLVGANNFSLEHLVIRNSSSGIRGKLITAANIDTKIGPFIDVDFRKSTHHVYQNDATRTLVDVTYARCHFIDANVYSRYYIGALFKYSEEDCYTQSCKRAMLISAVSVAEIGGVFELMEEGAVYVVNTSVFSDVIRSLKFKGIHFEANGLVTPSPDVTVNVSLSLARIEFDSCGFYVPSVAKPIELSASPQLRLFHHNCENIDFSGYAVGSVIASATPKRAGQTDAFFGQGGNIGTDGQIYAAQGFHAQSNISCTITGAATPTPISMPGAGAACLVLVTDSTTPGAALLMLHGAATIVVISSSLTSITFTAVSSVLNGNTTGGASSRVLFFNYMTT